MDLAEKASPTIDWIQDNFGTSEVLVTAVANIWQYNKETGAISVSAWGKVKIDEVVDTRCLP